MNDTAKALRVYKKSRTHLKFIKTIIIICLLFRLSLIDDYLCALSAGKQDLAAGGYGLSQLLPAGLDADPTVSSYIEQLQNLR